MVEITDTRRQRLEELLRKQKGRAKQRALATLLGKAPAQISQWINGTRTLHEESAREIERKLKLPDRWMDNVGSTTPAPPGWPFHQVDRARWERLSPDDQAYVQSVMNLAISQREHAALAPAGGGLHTGHAPAPDAPLVHEPGQRAYGT